MTVNCRIGSLEILTHKNSPTWYRELPHRQLRKITIWGICLVRGELPHRQLRNQGYEFALITNRELPNWQLRKDITPEMPIEVRGFRPYIDVHKWRTVEVSHSLSYYYSMQHDPCHFGTCIESAQGFFIELNYARCNNASALAAKNPERDRYRASFDTRSSIM